MSLPAIERNTSYFYEWEERGRGWVFYDIPVEIEPPFEPFIPPSNIKTPHYIDDARRESLLDGLKRGVKNLFKAPAESEKKEPEYSHVFSYPEKPVPFQVSSRVFTYRISVPKGYEVRLDEAEKLLHMLGYVQAPISFEILGTPESIIFQWSCREEDKGRLVTQLRAYFPEIAITQHDDSYDIPFTDKANVAIADMGLSEEFIRPLASVSKFSPDPLIGIAAALEQLSFGEIGMVQILFQGSMNPWSGAILNSVSDGQGGSFFVDAPEMPRLAQEKVSSPLYAVLVRVIAQGYDDHRSEHIAHELIQSLMAHSKSQHNTLIPLSNEGYSLEDHLRCVLERTSHRLGMMLNSKELVSFVHIPSASVTSHKVSRQAVKTKALPKDLLRGTYRLGINEHIGQRHEAYLTDEHRLRHMHVIGATGVGKSTLLAQLFLQDIKHGNGCAMFDPHGDTIDDIVDRIPLSRINDVILCDPSDTEYPIGFNLLQATTDIEKIVLSSDLVDTFKARSITWGDTMTSVLANALTAFLESEKGGTLLELRKFLVDEKFRKRFLETVHDSRIASYWHDDFPQLRKGSLAPLLTRLDTFLRPKIVRNMMAQQKGIDFNEVLSKKKILLVKLAQGLIGEDNSYLLGTLILAKLYQAAQARQSIAKDERTPYYVYIDEFHHFATPSLSAILSGARKFGFGLVLAHQELNQVMNVDANVGNSILSNPSVRICFRLGDNDAHKLETGFQYFDSSDLQNLGIGEAIVKVGRSDYDFNIITEKLSDSTDGNNRTIIYENSRKKYATPKSEVEKSVDEILKPEEKSKQDEVKFQTKPPKETIILSKKETPFQEEILSTQEVIKRTEKDVTQTSEDYVENVEHQREIKEHRHIQEYVKKMGEQRGFKADLETATEDGGRIDIVLTKNDMQIACEISVTNTIEYEVQNLNKCLRSGHTRIVMLCNNGTHLRNIQQAAQQSIGSAIQEKISFLHSDKFIEYLDRVVMQEVKTETRTRGYRVKTSFNTSHDAEQKKKIIKDTILKSMQRKSE